MESDNEKLSHFDTGMCPHGNFADGCATCKENEDKAENMMTKEQKVRSEIRADFYEKRKDMGIEQDVRRETYEDGNIKRVSAVIDGHKFEIDFDRSGASVAKIDGYVLSDEEKRRIPDKYYEVIRELSVDDEERIADKEIRKSALKDILK